MMAARRRLMAAAQSPGLELPVNAADWTVSRGASFMSLTEINSTTCARFSTASSEYVPLGMIATNQIIDFAKYTKCSIHFSLSSLSTSKTAPALAYIRLVCGSSTNKTDFIKDGYSQSRRSYDWPSTVDGGWSYMAGIYRNDESGTMTDYPALPTGEHIAEFDISHIDTAGAYFAMSIAAHNYSVDARITKVVLS